MPVNGYALRLSAIFFFVHCVEGAMCSWPRVAELASVMPSVLPSVKLACTHTSTPARNNLTTIQCKLIVLRPRKRSTRSELCNPEHPCDVKDKYLVSQPRVCVTSLVFLS